MISFILFAILALVTYLTYKKVQSTSNNSMKLFDYRRVIATLVIGVLFIMIQPFTSTVITAGNVGIKVSLLGDDRGVGKYEYVSGYIFYNSWTTKVEEIPLTQQHVEYEKQVVPSYGGLPVDVYPKFNYSVKGGNAGDMYVNLRKPLEQIEKEWLSTAVLQAVADITNRWKVDSIFTHKEAFEAEINLDANKRVGKWFVLSQLRTNILPPGSLINSIRDKTKAIQDVQVADQRKLVAIAEGITKREGAKADSAVRVINAASEAKANSLRQASLTPMLIQQQWIQAWRDGGSQVPSVVTSGGSQIWNMGEMIKKR